jgi:hypothetical protein
VPALQQLFSFAPLHADDLALSLLAGVGCLLWLEIFKWLRQAERRRVPPLAIKP